MSDLAPGPFLFFGTMMDSDVMALVLGTPIAPENLEAAVLRGFRRVKVRGETYPMLVPDGAASVSGILARGLSRLESDRLSFFESHEYLPTPVAVENASGVMTEAHLFMTHTDVAHDGQEWTLEQWRRDDKDACLEETRIWMALYGRMTVLEADAAWDAVVAAGRPPSSLIEELEPTGG